jgi:hypothetical protein
MKYMASRPQFRFLFCAALALCSTVAVQAQNLPTASPIAAAQVAAVSPKVTYINGQLTIRAQDASLGDILRAVSTKTGAVIEFPADRAQEHLFANAGPGPVREVLESLLNGSRFNYVMVASPANPNLLQRMILTSSEEPANSAVMDQPVQAGMQPPVIAAPQAQPLPPLPASVAQESQQMEMEAPKEALSPDVVEAMMKARKEARKQQREQDAASGSSSSQ